VDGPIESFPHLGEACELSAAAVGAGLRIWMQNLKLWHDALYANAKVIYLEHNGKLPGSERTARLRKKRMMMVMRWYHHEFLAKLPLTATHD
jgi:hypothetical protein